MGIYGLLRSLSLHLIIKNFKKDFKFFDTAKNLLITQFFNGITPFASGGQPAQIYFLKKNGVPIPTGTSIIIQNFMVYQIILVLYGLFAIILNHFFNFFPKVILLKNLIILGFSINALVMIFLLFISKARKLNKVIIKNIVIVLNKLKIVKNKYKVINKLNLTLDRFHENSKSIQNNFKLFFKCLLCNFVAFPLLYSIPLIIIYSTGSITEINFITSFVACSFVMIIGAFVPIPGGSGGLEFAFARFYGNYITGPVLSTALLIWRFITYYLGMIAGAIALSINKRR